MRRFAFRVDQLPAWAFVLGAALAFSIARTERLFALLYQSRGGMELGAILTLAVFLAVMIFAVRRRQVSAWQSSTHVLASLVAGNAMAIVAIWPFLPRGYPIALGPLLRDTVMAGASMAIATLPFAVVLL